jgi:hypothetical protein
MLLTGVLVACGCKMTFTLWTDGRAAYVHIPNKVTQKNGVNTNLTKASAPEIISHFRDGHNDHELLPDTELVSCMLPGPVLVCCPIHHSAAMHAPCNTNAEWQLHMLLVTVGHITRHTKLASTAGVTIRKSQRSCP